MHFKLSTSTNNPEWDTVTIIDLKEDRKLKVSCYGGQNIIESKQQQINEDIIHSIAGNHLDAMLLFQTNTTLIKSNEENSFEYITVLQAWSYEDLLLERNKPLPLPVIQSNISDEIMAQINGVMS